MKDFMMAYFRLFLIIFGSFTAGYLFCLVCFLVTSP